MTPRLLQTHFNAGANTPARIVDGDGVYFVLDDGRRVLDGSNTGGPLGHRHPALVEAVRAAADRPVVNDGWLWAEREDAARELIERAFSGETSWVGAVRFCLSGSEANDLALSLSQALTGRTSIATRERAYHGMAGLSREVTVQPHWHGGLSRYEGGVQPVPRLARVVELPAPLGARYGGRSEMAANRLQGAAGLLDDVAAVIVDYTQGGIYYDADYQDRVAAMARAGGALWIADEVVTGLGRYGRWFAFQGAASRPDIVTLGKPLAGGASPAGAVVVSAALADELKGGSWQTYSTFRGHALMLAALTAYLRVVEEEGLVERAAAMDSWMEERLLAVAAGHPSVARVDGRALHWTVELFGPDWRDWTADSGDLPLASEVAFRALEHGALIGTSGEQTSLFLAPALTMSEPDLERLIDALDVGLSAADEMMGERS